MLVKQIKRKKERSKWQRKTDFFVMNFAICCCPKGLDYYHYNLYLTVKTIYLTSSQMFVPLAKLVVCEDRVTDRHSNKEWPDINGQLSYLGNSTYIRLCYINTQSPMGCNLTFQGQDVFSAYIPQMFSELSCVDGEKCPLMANHVVSKENI